MNRRSFLSSLAALSLPAVVAGKVVSAAPPDVWAILKKCDAEHGYSAGLCDCCTPTSFTVEITGWDGGECTIEPLNELLAEWSHLHQIEPAPRITGIGLWPSRSCTVTPIG